MKYIKSAILSLTSVFLLNSCTEELPGVGSIEDKTPPSADFSFKPSTGSYKEVNFTNLSISASEYAWDFGGGETSVEANPTFIYPTVGFYPVTLTAKDGNGLTSVKTDTVEIVNLVIAAFECPSFECSDRSVWGSYSGSGSPAPPDGESGAKFSANSTSHSISQVTPVASGQKYKIAFYYVSKSNNGVPNCANIRINDEDSGFDYVNEGIPVTDNASDYVAISYVFDVKPETENLRFSLSPGPEEVRFDMVTIEIVN